MKFYLMYSNGYWKQSMIQSFGKSSQDVRCGLHIVEHCQLISSYLQSGVFLSACQSLFTDPDTHTFITWSKKQKKACWA